MLTSSYQPRSGRFLISEPFMNDPNFRRTVVLLVEHNEQGSLGFVMNRPIKNTLNELVEDLPSLKIPVYLGGPVEQNTLHFVYRTAEPFEGAKKIAEGVFWGGDFEGLKEELRNGNIGEDDVLFFVGYSGWGTGQLTEEMERKSWIVAPEKPEFVFAKDHDDLWRTVLQDMGTKYKVISNYPVDPRMN